MPNWGPMRGMLEAYRGAGTLRMHMPGHKGLDLPEGMIPGYAAYDVTEIPGWDGVADPREALSLSQAWAARMLGAEHAFYLTAGSTQGIFAMLQAVAGERILVPRNCHVSVLHGMLLAGVEPIWLPLEMDEEGLARRLEANWTADGGKAAALWVTYPDYYGRCCDLQALCRWAHERDLAVFVDAAHGAHLSFSPLLPRDPGACGADAWVISTHKTLPAYTQTAILLARGAWAERVQEGLTLVSSTSPGYPLYASIEEALGYMAQQDFSPLYEACWRFRNRIAGAAGLRCLENEDPTRLVVDVAGRGLTGWEAERLLRAKNVQAEMGDDRRIVFIATAMDTPAALERAATALLELPRGEHSVFAVPPPLPRSGSIPLAKAMRRGCWVKLVEAAGCITAAPFGAYPPGIPLCMPGERIEPELLTWFDACLAAGGTAFGLRNGCVRAMEVE